MDHDQSHKYLIEKPALILVTGAAGFIGSRVVEKLVESGFCNIRCFIRSVRPGSPLESLSAKTPTVEVFQGNLLSLDDCIQATRDVSVIFHAAAGRGEKSYPDAFLNSVVTTRNLIEAALSHGTLRRFVNLSSFSVYSNRNSAHVRVLDESCPVEVRPESRGDAYTYAKVKQDELVREYGRNRALPYVIVRPGQVYGAGNEAISGRVGIDTFGIFLHLGGSNPIPLTYVDNCAEAVVLAGLKPGVDGETFNVVDDDLPSSRSFLKQYKKQVRPFRSLYVPHICSYMLCWLWEMFSTWSKGQVPPVFNRKRWHSYWKRTKYSNCRIKEGLGWMPRVSTTQGLGRYFEACRARGMNA